MAVLRRSPGISTGPIREIYDSDRPLYLRITRKAAERRARRSSKPATSARRPLTVSQVRRLAQRGKLIRLKLAFAKTPPPPSQKQQPKPGLRRVRLRFSGG